VAADLGAIAHRLFAGVMAPLVLGGELRPGHAIGARAALALGWERIPDDPELAARVHWARVRRARQLAPVDRLGPPTHAEWALCAALHDLLQSASPIFDAPLRRAAAARIRDLAVATIDRVPGPADVRDALSRHAWLARVLDVARTDTNVSWWVGSRTYLGVDPPARLQSWPDLRRVRVVATPRPLLELGPLAFDRTTFVDAVGALLARTPLTDLATCTRETPAFAWSGDSLGLVATRVGRTLAMRALSRIPASEVDAALGRATRGLALPEPIPPTSPALVLLAERAIAEAQGHVAGARGPDPAHGTTRTDAAFARALGAAIARSHLEMGTGWSDAQRRKLLASLEPAARSAAAREALAMVRGP
jgi:hypothetical protein